jgi:23S rRNA G2445 N2-methylase RlmL
LSSSPSNAFFATAPRGLEALLQKEISSLGGENPALVPGGVAFGGGWDVCYRMNL